MFSKTCEYGIKAIVFIAVRSLRQERVSLKEIAKEIDSPVAFTAKILQQLVKNGIVNSLKGPTGGFLMNSEKMKIVNLRQIVYAIDGDHIYNGCGLGLKYCDADMPCPVHDKFAVIRNDLKKMLETTSVYELADGLTFGVTCLKR